MFSIYRSRAFVISNIALFAFLLLFFVKIHPYIPFTGDDWIFLGKFRTPVPRIGGWNPCRVFPEFLLPIIGTFSARIFYPAFDYITSIVIGYGIILSLAITFLYSSVASLVMKLFHFRIKESALVAGIFLLLSFLIFFRHDSSLNYYMFYATSITHSFFYTISYIMNSCMLIYIFTRRLEGKSFRFISYTDRGFLLICLYLSVFSNLYASLLLFAYCLSFLIIKFFALRNNLEKHRVKTMSIILTTIKRYTLEVYLCLVWIITGFIETTGGDAAKLSKNVPVYYFPIEDTVQHFMRLLSYVNPLYYIMFTTVIVFLIIAIRYGSLDKYVVEAAKINAFALVFSLGALLILASKTGAIKASYIHVMYPIFYFSLILVITILGGGNKKV